MDSGSSSMIMFLLVSAHTLVLSGLFSGFVAQEKGRDTTSWVIRGFLCGPIALIAVGLSPAKNSAVSLHEAVNRKDKQAIAGILANHVNPDSRASDTTTPLMAAAKSNDVEILELLINHGALLELKDRRGRTALGIAVEAGACNSVSLLLSRGANADSPNSHAILQSGGCLLTPLQHASISGRVELVRLLVKHDAQLDRKFKIMDLHGVTELHLAARMGQLEIVKELIQYGAKADATDSYQRTPLCHAAAMGHLPIVQFFLDIGATGGISGIKLALKPAKDGRHRAIIELLEVALAYEMGKLAAEKAPTQFKGQQKRRKTAQYQSVQDKQAEPIRIFCPHCGHSLAIPGHLRGSTGRCKKCGGSVSVPP
jgi:ankyrin repeat protein